MVGIYKITNNINGKSYIGQSKHIKRRWREHINGTEGSAISKAIKKYGAENFSFEIIERCSIDCLDDKEVYYIEKYNTFKEGYNMTVGGDGVKGVGKVLTYEDVPNIIKDLRKGLTAVEMAKKYSISVSMIRRINAGHDWVIEGEIYPIRNSHYERVRESIDKEELLKDVAILGFKGAGKKYGLTGNGVKTRCRMVGLPTRLHDIKSLYGIKEDLIVAEYKGKEIEANTIEELVDYIKESKLTYASRSNIASCIRRTLRGDRKTYLGLTIKYEKESDNI